MSHSEFAIAFVMSREGGFVDNPNDSGGATNTGISLRFLRELPIESLRKYGIFKTPESLTAQDVKDLSDDQIKLIYKDQFWDKANLDNINVSIIAAYILDLIVLHGLNQGIKIVQRAIWAIKQTYQFLKDDGIMGKVTAQDVNHQLSPDLLSAMMAERAGFMRLIASQRSKDGDFLNGWLHRCYTV